MKLRRLARRYRDGEELETLGETFSVRLEGLDVKIRALQDARYYGFDISQLLDEVAQIDVEEDDVQ